MIYRRRYDNGTTDVCDLPELEDAHIDEVVDVSGERHIRLSIRMFISSSIALPDLADWMSTSGTLTLSAGL